MEEKTDWAIYLEDDYKRGVLDWSKKEISDERYLKELTKQGEDILKAIKGDKTLKERLDSLAEKYQSKSEGIAKSVFVIIGNTAWRYGKRAAREGKEVILKAADNLSSKEMAGLSELYKDKPEEVIKSVFYQAGQFFMDLSSPESFRGKTARGVINNLSLEEMLHLSDRYKDKPKEAIKSVFDTVCGASWRIDPTFGTVANEKETVLGIVAKLSLGEVLNLAYLYKDRPSKVIESVFKMVSEAAKRQDMKKFLKVITLAGLYKDKSEKILEKVFYLVGSANYSEDVSEMGEMVDNLSLNEALNLADLYKNKPEKVINHIFGAVAGGAAKNKRFFLGVVDKLSLKEVLEIGELYQDKPEEAANRVFWAMGWAARNHDKEIVLKVTNLAGLYKDQPEKAIKSAFDQIGGAARGLIGEGFGSSFEAVGKETMLGVIERYTQKLNKKWYQFWV